MRQLGPLPATALWASFSLSAGLYGAWLGEGGRALAAALISFAILLFVLLLFAARGVTEKASARLGPAAGIILGAILFLAYLIYASGTDSFTFARTGAIVALVFLPLALAVSEGTRPPGAWQDFAVVAAVWAVVKFSHASWLWPYPGGKVAAIFTVLLMVDAGIAVFMLARGISGVGYSLGWDAGWGFYITASFVVFGCVATPLGLSLGFLQFAPHWGAAVSLPLVAITIFLFTAWPEEFLFRGLLQNMLSRATGSEYTAWFGASILFGLSHITNGHFPNWRYVLLATIAGLFYGWTWRKTGSIFASAIVHALVDSLWHFLFRTV